MDCVFCRIVAGDAPARTVYRDESTVAFLDAHPLAPGHTLIVPVDHHERVEAMPADGAGEFFGVVRRLIEPVQTAVDAPGSTIAVNNGPAAGQEIPHVHCHVVPRFPDDGGGPIHAAMGARPTIAADELDAIADRIAAAA